MEIKLSRAGKIVTLVRPDLRPLSDPNCPNEPEVKPHYLRDTVRRGVRAELLRGGDKEDCIYRGQYFVGMYNPSLAALAAHFYEYEQLTN
jgi:hypothetical protein